MTAANESVPSADEAFGLVINQTAFRKHITKKKLAVAMKITPGAVSKKLRGERPWTLDDQIRAADALQEDLRDLLGEMWRDDPSAIAHPQRRASDGWALGGSNSQPTDYKVEGSVTEIAIWRMNKRSNVA